jgi:hypothetical protein
MRLCKIFLSVMVTNLIVASVYSQSDGMDPDEQYCRANIAYSSPMILGVDESNYARCVRGKNYLEPGRTPSRVVINGVDFVDDGQNNDIKANDGILTSTQLFPYAKGGKVLSPGEYQAKSNLVIIDPIFEHTGKIGPDRIKVTIKFVWVKCTSWPQEYQQICYRLCRPFNGSLELTEVTITFE